MSNILQKHQGCADQFGCMGPNADYYTVFGSELHSLGIHALLAIALCGFMYRLLFLKKPNTFRLQLPQFLILAMFIFDAMIIFLVLTYFFPVKTYY